MKKLNIVLVSAEFAPFAKTGGLADATTSLAKGLAKLGHNVICIMPKYGIIDTEKHTLSPTFLTLNIPLGVKTKYAHLLRYDKTIDNLTYYFVEHDMLYDRDGVYSDSTEFFDNDKRFIFLSRAVFEACKALDFTPDVIHAHDNHTAFAMPFLKLIYSKEKRFADTVGVFTIHNLAYQGKYNQYRAMDYSTFGMKHFIEGSDFEHYGTVNSMKIGIMFSDKVTTVSPSYAKEIRMHYYGESLHDTLNAKGNDLVGVLNGVDYEVWSPANDEYLSYQYDSNNLELKDKNKLNLLQKSSIKDTKLPLIGMVTRLAEQKGIDLIKNKIEEFLTKKKINFVILGSGEVRYTDFLQYLKHKYAENVHVEIGYNEQLAHNIIAGSDYLLIPSRFEPCGLTQMYSLRYGTVPIVRKTGGLSDTITEYDVSSKNGNGFIFENYNADEMNDAIYRALSIYKAKNHWDTIRQNGMSEDHSFERSAKEYTEVYQSALSN